MELHIQRCQFCSSRNMKNILTRSPGQSDKVYVQCQDCGAFVASYQIAPMGYYHHGKGYDSFLRSLHRGGEFMSGRSVQQMYLDRKEDEEDGFEEVQQALVRKAERKAQAKAKENTDEQDS